MFENRLLRNIFGPKRHKVKGDRRRLHNEELHYLNSPPPDKKKKPLMRWAGLVACMVERKNAYPFRWEACRKKNIWIDLWVGGKIILQYNSNNVNILLGFVCVAGFTRLSQVAHSL